MSIEQLQQSEVSAIHGGNGDVDRVIQADIAELFTLAGIALSYAIASKAGYMFPGRNGVAPPLRSLDGIARVALVYTMVTLCTRFFHRVLPG